MDLSPVNLGMIASYYYINYTTIGEHLCVVVINVLPNYRHLVLFLGPLFLD